MNYLASELTSVFVLASEEGAKCAEKVSSRINTSDLIHKLSDRLSVFPTKSVDSLSDECADDDSFPSGKGESTDISDNVSLASDLNSEICRISLGQEIAATSVAMMRIFLGIDEDIKNTFGLNWSDVVVRDRVTCRNTTVIGSAWNAVSCTTRIDADVATIFDLLYDDSRNPEFDKMFDFITPLVVVDPKTAIRRVCCKPVWPTAPRDLLVCTTHTEQDDGSRIICSRFAPDDILAKQKGYVRATLLISGYWIQPLSCLPPADPLFEKDNDRACKLTLTIHSDLGGYLPASLMNYVTTDTPLNTMSLIRQVAHNDMNIKHQL